MKRQSGKYTKLNTAKVLGDSAYEEYLLNQYRREREARLKRKKRRTRQMILRLVLIFVAVLVIAFGVLQIFPVYASARMEAGTEVNAKDFLRFPWYKASFAEDSEPFDKNVPGVYHLDVKAGLFPHKCTLTIEDTTAPELEVRDLIAGVGDSTEVEAFVVSTDDLTETSVAFGKAPDPSIFGSEQEITVVASDTSGNTTEKSVKLMILPIHYRVNVEAGSEAPDVSSFVTDEWIDEEETYYVSDVSAIDYSKIGENDIEIMYQGTKYPAKICIVDTQAPVFSMSENFTSYLGESIRYKTHVTVSDNSGAYDLEIDTSKVDPNTVGSYEVIYTATDASGNSASATLTLTIAEKTANEAELFERADAILADLINDNMTQREKAEAIYYYIYDSYYFYNDSNKDDYVIAALDMLNSGQGDCFSFFALAKTMLTRAGIKNMDIQYFNRPIREHYWNLVDVEDGHGWYHYDTTRREDRMQPCLWTDEQIKENNDGRWNYNPDDYPPIP